MSESISKISKCLEAFEGYNPQHIHPNDGVFIGLFVDFLNENNDPENNEIIIQYVGRDGFGSNFTVTINDITNGHLFGLKISYNKQHIVVKLISSNKYNVAFQVRPYIDLNTLDSKNFWYVYHTWREFLRTKFCI